MCIILMIYNLLNLNKFKKQTNSTGFNFVFLWNWLKSENNNNNNNAIIAFCINSKNLCPWFVNIFKLLE